MYKYTIIDIRALFTYTITWNLFFFFQPLVVGIAGLPRLTLKVGPQVDAGRMLGFTLQPWMSLFREHAVCYLCYVSRFQWLYLVHQFNDQNARQDVWMSQFFLISMLVVCSLATLKMRTKITYTHYQHLTQLERIHLAGQV